MITIDATMWIHILNILILIAVMNAVLYRPVRAMLKERRQEVATLETDIETFETNSRLRLEESGQKLAEARSKAKEEFDVMRGAALAGGSEKIAAVRLEADKEKSAGLADIAGQFEKAKGELQSRLDSFARDMADKILGRAA
ncbi:MAG: ATP synthase F0 subunit B [Deltaproteobacteria bacterium]|nr:ATP synthase F0 subunit B [Deltaproteobacteria bacterium]